MDETVEIKLPGAASAARLRFMTHSVETAAQAKRPTLPERATR
jgi:hypothetical protein